MGEIKCNVYIYLVKIALSKVDPRYLEKCNKKMNLQLLPYLQRVEDCGLILLANNCDNVFNQN
jgi:hypothetical protein